MNKQKFIFYLIFGLFFLSLVVFTLGLGNCGVEQYLAPGCHLSADYCSAGNLDIFSLIRGALIFGLIASVFSIFFVKFKLRIYSVWLRRIFISFNPLYKNFFSGLMKPFDNLLLAYSHGLINAKIALTLSV